MIEPEVPLKRKDQVALDEDLARNLQAQLEDELIEEERLARKKEEEANIALIESGDNTQAMMEADFELAQRLQTEEQGEITIEERSRLFKAESSEEKAKGSRKKIIGKKRAGKEQQQESSKRHRMEDDKETDEHEEVEVDDEAELKNHLVIGIDKEDLETLWKLVKTKHGDTRPEDEHERVLWGDLKVMFEPNIKRCMEKFIRIQSDYLEVV
ncbi:hypothetical protein Tco_0232704 [Tanacetum coccineum]